MDVENYSLTTLQSDIYNEIYSYLNSDTLETCSKVSKEISRIFFSIVLKQNKIPPDLFTTPYFQVTKYYREHCTFFKKGLLDYCHSYDWPNVTTREFWNKIYSEKRLFKQKESIDKSILISMDQNYPYKNLHIEIIWKHFVKISKDLYDRNYDKQFSLLLRAGCDRFLPKDALKHILAEREYVPESIQLLIGYKFEVTTDIILTEVEKKRYGHIPILLDYIKSKNKLCDLCKIDPDAYANWEPLLMLKYHRSKHIHVTVEEIMVAVENCYSENFILLLMDRCDSESVDSEIIRLAIENLYSDETILKLLDRIIGIPEAFCLLLCINQKRSEEVLEKILEKIESSKISLYMIEKAKENGYSNSFITKMCVKSSHSSKVISQLFNIQK